MALVLTDCNGLWSQRMRLENRSILDPSFPGNGVLLGCSRQNNNFALYQQWSVPPERERERESNSNLRMKHAIRGSASHRINQPISPSRISTRRTSWLGFGARHNLQSPPTSSVFVGNCPEFEVFTAGCAFPFPFQEKEGASPPIEFLFFIRVFLHSLDLELMGLEALPIV